MRRLGLLALVWMTCAGCNSVRPKHDNPVMQAPPRRVSWDDSQIADAAGQTPANEIQRASAVDSDEESQVFNARVVARVNGAPVFAGEVLERWGPYLKTAQTKMSPDEFVQLRNSIIQRDLRGHIERRLLAERMRSSLKAEQIKQLEAQVDKAFEDKINELKRETGTSTRTELELALNERGTTLESMRQGFATQQLAMQYMRMNIERPQPVTRPELVTYYQQHLDDYKIPAKVLWQQIQVSITPRQSTSAAEKKINDAKAALSRGDSFEAVVKQFSDGPTADSEGRWDWTNKGSLAETKLEESLFALPVGQVSAVIQGKQGYHIVRVLDRQLESHRQFFDVQDEIAEKLETERQDNLPQKFVQQLYDEAIIETPFQLTAAN